VIGLFTLIVVVYKVGGGFLTKLEYQPRNWHGYLAGWASGFGSALANIGAPPFTAYMMLRKVPPVPFIGTTTLLFAIVNALKLPITLLSSRVLDPHLLLSILWVVPLIPVGVLVGRWGVGVGRAVGGAAHESGSLRPADAGAAVHPGCVYAGVRSGALKKIINTKRQWGKAAKQRISQATARR